jgi:hypothetical protein
MSTVIDRLQVLLDTVQAAITASDLDRKTDITVTDDGREVATAFSLSAGAVVVYPLPGEEFPAPRVSRLTWTIGVVAAGETPRDAASRIHDIKAVLHAAKVLRPEDRATPTDFELPDQSSIPGYAITHIEEHQL